MFLLSLFCLSLLLIVIIMIIYLSKQATPTLLPLLLQTLPLSSPHLTLASLTLLSYLFSAARAASLSSAEDADGERATGMDGGSVRETLEALIEARPKGAEQQQGEGGEKLLSGWTEGVGEGMVAFAR